MILLQLLQPVSLLVTILLCVLSVTTTTAFLISINNQDITTISRTLPTIPTLMSFRITKSKKLQYYHATKRQTITSMSLNMSVLSATKTIVDGESLEYLTSNQIKTLRKEIQKRQSKKQLQAIYLDDDETMGELNTDTIQNIISILHNDELIQIRSIAISSKRDVYTIAEEISYIITEAMSSMNNNNNEDDDDESNEDLNFLPVFLIDHKGHSATYYSPTTGTIQLRTTGKSNKWEKRQKPLRDNSGQIIR